VYSCIRCSDRKVKCDRQSPCGACVKHNVDCIYSYHPSHPARKKHRRGQDHALIDRLKHYENLLQERGIDPELRGKSTPPMEAVPVAHTPRSQSTSSPSVEPEPNQRINKTQIVHGQGHSKFVDKSVLLGSIPLHIQSNIVTVAYGPG